jgi:type I restriction enzyme S subunit
VSRSPQGERIARALPTEWGAERLKFLADIRFSNVDKLTTNGEDPIRLCNYVDVYHHDKITSDLEFMSATASPNERLRFLLHPGDVLITKDSESWDDIAVPALVEVDAEDLVCGYHLALIRPRQTRIVGAFLAHAIGAQGVRDQLWVEATGITRYGLSQSAIQDALIPAPPVEIQRKVAEFLDRETAKIDALVAEKERLIELLEEKRTALITHAVTKGLDPDVPMKDSGVGWLGGIPDHWEVSRAEHVCSFTSAKAHEQFVDPDGDHICVTARFVSTDGRSIRRCTKNLSPAQRGDALMVMSDLPNGRALARAYLVDDERSYAVNQRVCILRPVHMNPKFLAFAVNRHPELVAHDDGLNQTHLPNKAFKIMRLPVPPPNEQAAIAEYLLRTTGVMTLLTESAKRGVDLLHEYRTALISAAVIGKINVRWEMT